MSLCPTKFLNQYTDNIMLMTINLVILFVGFVAVAVAYRHGLSKGYEQNVNNNIELEKALRGKERELKEEQKLSEDYREEIKRQAHDLRIMNNCNLGLNERLYALEEELKQAQRRAESKLNRATRTNKHTKR